MPPAKQSVTFKLFSKVKSVNLEQYEDYPVENSDKSLKQMFLRSVVLLNKHSLLIMPCVIRLRLDIKPTGRHIGFS